MKGEPGRPGAARRDGPRIPVPPLKTISYSPYTSHGRMCASIGEKPCDKLCEIGYKEIMNKFICLLIATFPLSALAAEITADSYLLVEKDSFAVIAGKDYHRPLPPASTTKVMTTILALEKLDEQESIVPTKKVLSIPAPS